MKVIAVFGSARKNGNGAFLVNEALQIFEKNNVEIEKILSDRYDNSTLCWMFHL